MRPASLTCSAARTRVQACVTQQMALQGLIPRVSKLAQLGGSFWLGLYPIILGLVGVTITLYAVRGQDFIHGGNQPMRMPSYVDPQELLYRRGSEPMVPYGQADRRGAEY